MLPRAAGKLTELGFQKLPADHNATERQKCEVYIGVLLSKRVCDTLVDIGTYTSPLIGTFR